MKTTILLSLAAIVVPIIFSPAAFPQEFPKYEFSGGFTYVGMEEVNWLGWKLSGAKNFNHYFGIEFDITGVYSSPTTDILWFRYKPDNRRYLFLAGPQFTRRNEGNWIPYLHVLAGVSMTLISSELITREGELVSTGSHDRNAFAMALGGGIDYEFKGPLALRLIQADFLNTHGKYGWQRGAKISCGLVIHLGSGGY